MRRNHPFYTGSVCLLAVVLLCGFRLPFTKKKYASKITANTQQPDKALYDTAVTNLEKGQYEAARLVLNTLINTYDSSEYLAKAELAIADSWMREGGSHAMSQAEAEYRNFILFYPNMEESAESQYKICKIHYDQMAKADRDVTEAQLAEDACRQGLVQFPNSKFKNSIEQMLRNLQEVEADKEFRTGDFYYKKGSLPAAISRMAYVVQQFPLYSGAHEALWATADSYRRLGDRFENQEVEALAKIVRDYPLSFHVDMAKTRLTELKRPVPQADPAAYARMKYEMENSKKAGMLSRSFGLLSGKPDVGLAAKSGTPAMQTLRPGTPLSVPGAEAAMAAAAAQTTGPGGVSDVAIGVANDSKNFDNSKDATLKTQNASGEIISKAQPAAPTVSNHPYTKKQLDEMRKSQEKAAKAAAKLQEKLQKQQKNTKPATPATPAQ